MKWDDIPRAESARLIASAAAAAKAFAEADDARIRESGLSAHAQAVVQKCMGLYALAGMTTGGMLAQLGSESSVASRLLYELAAAAITNIEAATARACEPYAAKERA